MALLLALCAVAALTVVAARPAAADAGRCDGPVCIRVEGERLNVETARVYTSNFNSYYGGHHDMLLPGGRINGTEGFGPPQLARTFNRNFRDGDLICGEGYQYIGGGQWRLRGRPCVEIQG
jgi:hypothetical protein